MGATTNPGTSPEDTAGVSSPSSPEPSPAPKSTIGWGILGTGKIAQSFAADLAVTPGARIAAVGSRSPGRADAIADAHGARSHETYEALVDDPEVEVVYIASPHSHHLEHARLAFAAGKHVLCEKPLTLNLADSTEMARLAGQHDCFLMEAMWTATHPLVLEIRRRLASGDFGVPRHVRADLGWAVGPTASPRMLDPALGGGALLDMGIYPLTFAHLMLGEAVALTATADLSPHGVDLDVAISGEYAGGATASLSASMTSWTGRTASIATTTGRIDLPADFHHPTTATWTPYDGGVPRPAEPIVAHDPVIGRGYGNEALEVMRCVREGLLQSPLAPHLMTLTIAGQMDDLLQQVGVTYP